MQRLGFTLVELAIALVIIGLVLGTILTGRDLMKSAEIASAVRQINQYTTATITFYGKYRGLPGDIGSVQASRYGLSPRSGLEGRGDADTMIEGCAMRESALGCETALYWIDMVETVLVTEDHLILNAIPDGDTDLPDLSTSSQMMEHIPNLPLRDSALIHVYPEGGRNAYLIGNFQTDGDADIQFNLTGGLTPNEALLIDTKIDDGFPGSGRVQAVASIDANGGGTTADSGSDPPDATHCVNASLSPSAYNVIEDESASSLTCNIRIISGF